MKSFSRSVTSGRAHEATICSKVMAKKKGQTEVHIYPDWCKGCGICVAFCPAGVFVLDEEGKAKVENQDECVNCGFCELHCPDFAVVVRPKKEKKKTEE